MTTKKPNRTDKGEPMNDQSWPRHTVNTIETRKRDVIVRIADWTRTKDCSAYDVEVYVHGVYDWNESKVFEISEYDHGYKTKAEAKRAAAEFAAKQIAKFL